MGDEPTGGILDSHKKTLSAPALFKVFARVGAFAFGGGYSMLPLVEAELVTRKGWATREQIIEDYGLAQTIPGVIGINTALLSGYRLAKIPGAIFSGLGIISPSIVIISLIALLFTRIADHPDVLAVLGGVRAGVVGIIAVAAYRFANVSVTSRLTGIICIAAFLLAVLTPIHVIIILLGGGAVMWIAPLIALVRKSWGA